MTGVVGRFAPSPTGPLHFGSVVTAVASYVDVHAQGGQWLLRIDDVDLPRIERGATAGILTTLEALSLPWDGQVIYQSARGAAYAEALAKLEARQLIYRCQCSRKTIGPRAYPGTCRAKRLRGDGACLAWRVKVDDEPVVVDDVVQGRYAQQLASHCGDFVLRRADGVYAYHLATVVDDAWSGVTQVTRGSDLLESTPRQIHLQRLLGLPTPRYAHLPVVLDTHGDKLSKQTHAPAVTPANAATAMFHALAFLGLAPPPESLGADCGQLLAWALPRWSLAAIEPAARAYALPA
ncbi:MAG: tRNA glutamyl-Q(34) synthetase GluQRS [Gammaproteobacteria bacterium]|jgi:glutamyl-Q tRNA(Asp) synthetase|nr:tRNA glutamyl-Q(34) synthetase GluQRS [Gammaproteobacteria bacterium]